MQLIEQGVSIRLTKKILEKQLKIDIKDDTFYKWIRRQKNNIPQNASKSNAIEKTNIGQG